MAMEPRQSSAIGITVEEREAAWGLAFRHSLDLHPNSEIEWERDRWREFGAPGIAQLCDEILQERHAANFTIPAETSRHDLDVLWQCVSTADAFGWVRSGGFCLLAALRMVFWYGPFNGGLAR
jgi:hypothetical protein